MQHWVRLDLDGNSRKKSPDRSGLKKVEMNFFLIFLANTSNRRSPSRDGLWHQRTRFLLYCVPVTCFLFSHTSSGPKWLLTSSHYISILANSRDNGGTKGPLPFKEICYKLHILFLLISYKSLRAKALTSLKRASKCRFYFRLPCAQLKKEAFFYWKKSRKDLKRTGSSLSSSTVPQAKHVLTKQRTAPFWPKISPLSVLCLTFESHLSNIFSWNVSLPIEWPLSSSDCALLALSLYLSCFSVQNTLFFLILTPYLTLTCLLDICSSSVFSSNTYMVPST